jgi:paraquat-inducible protein B
MAENIEQPEQLESGQLPAAQVHRRPLSLIWLVPLVAALIGGWLLYKTVTEIGPTVTITFRNAEGLEPGKTKIKFKDVEIGQVEEIRLSKDLSQVIVTARLVKEAEDYLREDTQFWVVRARVATNEVSGLSTLFSGAYIGVNPGTGTSSVRAFKGLEGVPVIMKGVPGRKFVLKTESLGSLSIGSPVYFRQIRVGQVLSYEFAPEGDSLLIHIFVEAPHDDQVRRNSRFWNASGIDISLGLGGAQLHTESLMTVLAGGIAFATPSGSLAGEAAAEGESFLLHENQQHSLQKIYTRKMPLLIVFEQSVRGLVVGAPVLLRGLPVGRVLEVNLDFDQKSQTLKIPVLIEIETERIRLLNPKGAEFRQVLEQLVDLGLRAQLKTCNLVTGQAIIDLDLHPGAAARKLGREGETLVLPTLETAHSDLVGSLGSLAAKLDQIPYAQLSGELRQSLQEFRTTLAQTRQLLASVDQQLVPSAGATLKEAQKALEQLQQTLDAEGPLSRETTQAMSELARAARSMRQLTDYLEQHPEAVLRGR